MEGRHGLIRKKTRPKQVLMADIRIYAARKIITMNRNRPDASHVAVKEGRVLGVGDLADLEGTQDLLIDLGIIE